MTIVRCEVPNQDREVLALLQDTPLKDKKVSDLVMEYFSHRLTLLFTMGRHDITIRLDSENYNMALAQLQMDWCRPLSDGKFGSDNGEVRPFHDGGSYGGIPRVSNLFIRTFQAYGCQNSGYGTLLLRAALEWGIQNGCAGRTTIDAVGNSHWWWYTRGFRSAEAKVRFRNVTNNEIAEELEMARKEGRKPDTTNLGSLSMEMPKSESAKWVLAIKKSPILTNPQSEV